MIDLEAIRARAAARVVAMQCVSPANVANRLSDSTAVSQLAALAGGAPTAAGTLNTPGSLMPSFDSSVARARAEQAETPDRFGARWDRLRRWGWSEAEAEAMAVRLQRRDQEADERVSCVECSHHRPGRCGNYRPAGLTCSDVGRDLAELLQRCDGFAP